LTLIGIGQSATFDTLDEAKAFVENMTPAVDYPYAAPVDGGDQQS
jgi:hypothetical protein